MYVDEKGLSNVDKPFLRRVSLRALEGFSLGDEVNDIRETKRYSSRRGRHRRVGQRDDLPLCFN